jgi:hypothetical protein
MNRRLVFVLAVSVALVVALGFAVWHYDLRKTGYSFSTNHAHTFPPETAFPTGVAVDASGNLYVVKSFLRVFLSLDVPMLREDMEAVAVKILYLGWRRADLRVAT